MHAFSHRAAAGRGTFLDQHLPGLSTWLSDVRKATAQLLWPEDPPLSTVPNHKEGMGFGVPCGGTFEPSAWSGSSLPTISGSTRVYQTVKPQKLILTEELLFTWTRKGRSVTTAVCLDVASDLRLISAYVGNRNCFPTAPNQDTGLSGTCFAYNALGTGLDWPTINPGIDVVVCYAVRPTVLYRCAPPRGFRQQHLRQVQVSAHLNCFGEALRA